MVGQVELDSVDCEGVVEQSHGAHVVIQGSQFVVEDPSVVVELEESIT